MSSLSSGAVTIITRSPDQTEALGKALAALLPAGSVVALRGELASGKTCLVRGMASYFARGDMVHSPTFTLVNEYSNDETRLLHVDLYRLSGPEEVADLGYAELFDSEAVCAVEWAELAEPLLPAARLDVFLEHAGEDCRRLTFVDHGVMPPGWFEVLLAC